MRFPHCGRLGELHAKCEGQKRKYEWNALANSRFAAYACLPATTNPANERCGLVEDGPSQLITDGQQAPEFVNRMK